MNLIIGGPGSAGAKGGRAEDGWSEGAVRGLPALAAGDRER
jgi:hypothetical protein